MGKKLFVGNLNFKTNDDDLRTLFSQAGQIKEIAMIMDRDTRQPKGFGFVEMTTQEEAEKAIKLFNESGKPTALIELETSREHAEALAKRIQGRIYQGRPLNAWVPIMDWK